MADEPLLSWAGRLKHGLAKTRHQLTQRLTGLLGKGQIDEALYHELEALLLTADMGPAATQTLLNTVREQVSRRQLQDAQALRTVLRDALIRLLAPLEKPPLTISAKPYIILMVGVNGAGKTTSIGKLIHYFQNQDQSILLAAADTFRAAAREQLHVWATRTGVSVLTQQSADPAAIAFDAVHAAHARNTDVVLIDTAGRLPTQSHLMEELRKVKRVIAKADPTAPHAIWLVLDANTGQNAVQQVQAFDDALGVTGLILTKLDGTARGGVIAAIAQARPIPIYFIGIGEQVDDLRPFVAADFANALFDETPP